MSVDKRNDDEDLLYDDKVGSHPQDNKEDVPPSYLH